MICRRRTSRITWLRSHSLIILPRVQQVHMSTAPKVGDALVKASEVCSSAAKGSRHLGREVQHLLKPSRPRRDFRLWSSVAWHKHRSKWMQLPSILATKALTRTQSWVRWCESINVYILVVQFLSWCLMVSGVLLKSAGVPLLRCQNLCQSFLVACHNVRWNKESERIMKAATVECLWLQSMMFIRAGSKHIHLSEQRWNHLVFKIYCLTWSVWTYCPSPNTCATSKVHEGGPERVQDSASCSKTTSSILLGCTGAMKRKTFQLIWLVLVELKTMVSDQQKTAYVA